MSDASMIATTSEVAEFLERHRACSKARPWAGRCATLAEAWDSCTVPDWLIWARKKAGFEEKGRLDSVVGDDDDALRLRRVGRLRWGRFATCRWWGVPLR